MEFRKWKSERQIDITKTQTEVMSAEQVVLESRVDRVYQSRYLYIVRHTGFGSLIYGNGNIAYSKVCLGNGDARPRKHCKEGRDIGSP